jgi:hypothetical protein
MHLQPSTYIASSGELAFSRGLVCGTITLNRLSFKAGSWTICGVSIATNAALSRHTVCCNSVTNVNIHRVSVDDHQTSSSCIEYV